MKIYSGQIQTPVGLLTVTADDFFIQSIKLDPCKEAFIGSQPVLKQSVFTSPLLESAFIQLRDYFAGTCRKFSLPLDFEQRCLPARLRPSQFRQTVWRELCSIPYGKTCSYSAVAARIGNPGAVRAVGGANHANPFIIVVPCHRVITSSGALGGYGQGPAVKKYLLDREKNHFTENL